MDNQVNSLCTRNADRKGHSADAIAHMLYFESRLPYASLEEARRNMPMLKRS